MKKVYVTGADGMLGREVVPAFSAEYEVRGTDLPGVDITDRGTVTNDILSFSPDLVIHLASMTDVDGCEKDAERAHSINVAGTENVAIASRDCGAALIYLSTGMIYNGRKNAPYIEYDAPDPVNVYGRTKFEGELAVKRHLSRYYIFNTCWLFGGGPDDRKFIGKMIDLGRKKERIEVVEDTFGSPTYTADLADALLRFIREGGHEGNFGRYHCVGRGCVDRLQLAREIFAIAGIEDCELVPVSSKKFDLPAPRPRMEAMSNYSLDLLGLHLMRDWRDALRDYISSTFA